MLKAWFCVLCLIGCGGSTPTAAAPHEQTRSPTLTYLGVAGWSLNTGKQTVLFDPYVTRAPVFDDDMVLVPDAAAIGRFIPERAQLIVVSHSHYDHVLDVPAIAHRTGAVVFGTRSTVELARAASVPEKQLAVASGGEELLFDDLRVRAVRALHSDIGMGNFPIAPHPQLPLKARDYREGNTLQYVVQFQGHTLYFVGTANFIEEQLHGIHADVAIVATGMRHKVADYTCRLLRAIGMPKLVLANHFDAFQEPLRPGEMPLRADTQADLAAFAAEVHACAPSTRVVVPRWLEPIPVD
jgi:L-ascorbate metabolism protein UlaG (beta-lactamase superfamily)